MRSLLASLGLIWALCTAPSLAQDSPHVAPATGMTVETGYTEDGAALLTVKAREVSVEKLVRLIAQRLSIDVRGFEAIDRDPKVTVNLVDRPWRDAVRWLLGSVGLDAHLTEGYLLVYEDVGPYPEAGEILEKASRRYTDVLRRYPEYPVADRARMAHAQVNEMRGPQNWGAAALLYDALVDDSPESELLPEALLRSADLQGKLGLWQQAALRYEQLARLESKHPYHALARLKLADALCRHAETLSSKVACEDAGTKALYVLGALDTAYPTDDPDERRTRLMVRARAYASSSAPVDALKAIDAAARYSAQGSEDPELLELRARSLARAGEHGAASTAWLAYAAELAGERHEDALVEAAREALHGGHELAVLMIAKQASQEGFGDVLASEVAEARARLGLPAMEVGQLDARAHLARGEAMLSARNFEAAVQALRPAFRARKELKEPELVRLAQAYARALHSTRRFDEAMEALRLVVPMLGRRSQREQIYVLASELYEDRNLLAEAIEAIKGRL